MATTIIQTSGMTSSASERVKMTGLQRYILRRSHPTSIFIEAVGYIWVAFYLWNHLAVEAILALLFSRLIANVVAFRADTDALAQTSVGRIALLHLQPLNMLVQLAGLVGIVYGLWGRETRTILAGLSIMLLGHLVGWAGVDKRFKLH